MPNQALAIPNEAGWTWSPLIEVCDQIRRGTAPSYVDQSDIYTIGQRCVTGSGFDPIFARPHDARRMGGTFAPRSGDVLLNSTGTGTIGRSCTFDGSGKFIVDGHVTVLRPKASVADGRWIEALLHSPWGQRHLEARCFSGSTNQVELSRIQLAATCVPVPSIEEQHHIAEILGSVDETIRSTKCLIAKLELVKQGLLQHLLTRGIDDDGTLGRLDHRELNAAAPLGRLPTRWEVRSVADLMKRGRPVTYGIVQPGEYTPGGIPLIRGQDYINGWQPLSSFFRVAQYLHRQYGRSITGPGDVLLTIVGATTGATAIVPGWVREANITQTTARLSFDSNLMIPEFGRLALDSEFGHTQVRHYVKGSAQPGLNLADVERFLLPVPPILEQKVIITTWATASRRLECEAQNLRKLILIREGLADDLLTGRVRVNLDEGRK